MLRFGAMRDWIALPLRFAPSLLLGFGMGCAGSPAQRSARPGDVVPLDVCFLSRKGVLGENLLSLSKFKNADGAFASVREVSARNQTRGCDLMVELGMGGSGGVPPVTIGYTASVYSANGDLTRPLIVLETTDSAFSFGQGGKERRLRKAMHDAFRTNGELTRIVRSAKAAPAAKANLEPSPGASAPPMISGAGDFCGALHELVNDGSQGFAAERAYSFQGASCNLRISPPRYGIPIPRSLACTLRVQHDMESGGAEVLVRDYEGKRNGVRSCLPEDRWDLKEIRNYEGQHRAEFTSKADPNASTVTVEIIHADERTAYLSLLVRGAR